MKFWKGECSRAFTDWRGLHDGVGDAAWFGDDGRIDYPSVVSVWI
jgi:hypothetical protein